MLSGYIWAKHLRANGIIIISSATPEKKTLFTFEQGSKPGTADERGIGLGLLLCKEFVEKHHGHIYVESEVGKGTAFIFTIPKSKRVFEESETNA